MNENESAQAKEGTSTEGRSDPNSSITEYPASPLGQTGSISERDGNDPKRFSGMRSFGKIPLASFSGFLRGLLIQNLKNSEQQAAQCKERIRECDDCFVWYEDAKKKAETQLDEINVQIQQVREMIGQLDQLEKEATLNASEE
ncbi:MAG: hypothetical protein VKK42_02390 [Lyngbya sp.]|nr:hypothetical protein [Lyngbya sp.]